MKKEKNPKPFSKNSFSAMSLGMNMTAGMVIFAYLGYLIDQKTTKGQAWTLAGIFLGLIYCGYEVWKLVRKEDEAEGKK